MKKTLLTVGMAATMAFGIVAPAGATQPVAPQPLLANLYEFDFEPYGGGSVSGVGYLAAPTSAKGPTLSVEVDGLSANTVYKLRFGGPEDGNTNPSRCSQTENQLAPFTGDNSEFQVDGASIPAGEEGVLRWTYDEMAEFTGDRVTEINNGEPVVLITTADGDIVACGELGGAANALANPTSRTFPVARVGGATPQSVNGSDVVVSGQVNLTGSLLTYDFTLRGDDLINKPEGGLQNHIIQLRSTASCDGTTDNALRQTVAAFTNLNRSTFRARSLDDLFDVFPRSYIDSGDSLRVRGSMILPGIDQNAIGNYGIVVMGLEGGSTDRPTGELQQREMTPSACLNLVDQANEVGPVALADASTISEIINAAEYRQDTDPEILRLYQAFFRRDPDVEGAKYWMSVSRGELDGTTYSNLQIARFFTSSSAEFQTFYEDAPSNDEFLTRVYGNVLGRNSDPEGYAYWLDILGGTNNSGANPTLLQGNRADVVFYVALGQEFVGDYPYLP